LDSALTRADLPVTVPEFALMVLGIGALGFIVGALRLGLAPGLGLGALCACLPLLYVRMRRARRQRAFTAQLPDVLTLLVSGLRAGHGLSQAMDIVVHQSQPPVSTEFARVARAVELGFPVQRALGDMAQRVGLDDLDLVVTAINVQYETGGNLGQTLEVIADTVRDRIRIQRDIRVMTAQQRYTGRILAGLPLLVALGLYLLNPGYMGRLFEPGWIRLLPLAGLVMQLAGFFVIRRIVDIEV
jgi:tight adherence protein B